GSGGRRGVGGRRGGRGAGGAGTAGPAVPTGVGAVAASCSQVNVSWGAVTDSGGSGLKGYNLYRNGTFVKLVLAPAVSTTDTGLAASTLYSYTVRAVDNAGNLSGPSAAASTNTPACPDTTPPTVPTGVTATAASGSQIRVGWTAATDSGGSGLKGYNVYRNGAWAAQVLTPATTLGDTGMAASATYTYTVTALDNAGNVSGTSAAVSATTPACPAAGAWTKR